MHEPSRGLVGKRVRVGPHGVEPSYFTDLHRTHVGTVGVVHAVVDGDGAPNPLVKVKFPPENQIVFFRLADLEIV